MECNTRGTKNTNNIEQSNQFYLQSLSVKLSKFFIKIILLTITLATLFSINMWLKNKPIVTKQHRVIAITQIIEHESLTQAKRGILDELLVHGYETGVNLKVIDRNAQGNIATAALIAKQLVNIKPDAIVAISTPSAQGVINANKNKQIPLIFSSVTDPVAARIIKDISIPEPILTGAVDAPQVQKTLQLIQSILPTVHSIGLVYNPGEVNSVKSIQLLKEGVGINMKTVEVTVSNTSQVKQALNSLIGKVDAIYIPSDNTVFAAMAVVVKTSRDHKLPIFSNDPDSVYQGVFACIGYTQYDVGREAGKLLVKTLLGEKYLKVTHPEKIQIFINKISAERIGLSVPEKIMGIKIKVVS